MTDDIIDLVLFLARKQGEGELRDDELIHKLHLHAEIITLTETSTVVTKTAHPVLWDEFVWDRATWG